MALWHEGDPGDREETAALDTWGKSVMCMKKRRVCVVFEQKSPRPQLNSFAIRTFVNRLVGNAANELIDQRFPSIAPALRTLTTRSESPANGTLGEAI
jgi:hypothetical protein